MALSVPDRARDQNFTSSNKRNIFVLLLRSRAVSLFIRSSMSINRNTCTRKRETIKHLWFSSPYLLVLMLFYAVDVNNNIKIKDRQLSWKVNLCAKTSAALWYSFFYPLIRKAILLIMNTYKWFSCFFKVPFIHCSILLNGEQIHLIYNLNSTVFSLNFVWVFTKSFCDFAKSLYAFSFSTRTLSNFSVNRERSQMQHISKNCVDRFRKNR